MTFSFEQMQQFLQWARANRVAQINIKDSDVSVAFYPLESEKQRTMVTGPADFDTTARLDMMAFGQRLTEDGNG